MPTPLLRILLAEDSLTEAGLTLRSLCADKGRGLELVFVSNRRCLAQSLLQFHPHAAFLALSLLQPDPYLSISLLHHAAPRIPLILFAPPADKDCAAKCLEAGAHDYMLEGFIDDATVARALRSALQTKSNGVVSVAPKSRRDSLTGLSNRSGLMHSVQSTLPDSPLSDSRLIVSVRLQNHKKLQAIAGPAVASQTLCQIASQLQQCVRRSDLIAHVSRGLFIIIVPDAGEPCLSSLRRRLESRLMHFNRHRAQLPCQFAVQAFPWRNSSPFSFQEILSSHFAASKHPALPLLAPAGDLLSRSLVRSER